MSILKLAFLSPALLLALTACGGGVPGNIPDSFDPVPPSDSVTRVANGSVQSVQSGVSLELRSDKTTYLADEDIQFTATLRNDSDYTLNYYLNSPCAPKLDIRFDGSDIFELRAPLGGQRGPLSACPGVIVFKELAPGASVEYSESWDQKYAVDGVVYELPAGDYPVSATFRGQLGDGSQPGIEVNYRLVLNVTMEKATVWWMPKDALSNAMQELSFVNWYEVNDRYMLCKLPNGFAYEVSGAGVFNAISEGEYQDGVAQGKAICGVHLIAGPKWQINFSSKKAGSNSYSVNVDVFNGRISNSQ